MRLISHFKHWIADFGLEREKMHIKNGGCLSHIGFKDAFFEIFLKSSENYRYVFASRTLYYMYGSVEKPYLALSELKQRGVFDPGLRPGLSNFAPSGLKGRGFLQSMSGTILILAIAFHSLGFNEN